MHSGPGASAVSRGSFGPRHNSFVSLARHSFNLKKSRMSASFNSMAENRTERYERTFADGGLRSNRCTTDQLITMSHPNGTL